VATAARRSVGELAWAWSRKLSVNDATPLVAVSLALFGLQQESDNTPTVFDMRETAAYKQFVAELGWAP
jgi:hypothetical protein